MAEYTTDLSRVYGISTSGLLQLLRAEGVCLRMQSITEIHLFATVPQALSFTTHCIAKWFQVPSALLLLN